MKEKAVLLLKVQFIFQNVHRYHDIAVSTYCILLKPYCNSKPLVYIEHREDNYIFFCFILAPGRKLDTHCEQFSHYNLFLPKLL